MRCDKERTDGGIGRPPAAGVTARPRVAWVVGVVLSAAGAAGAEAPAAAPSPETVAAIYRVQPGREAELTKVLARHWSVCRRLGLALEEPHLVLRGRDETGKTYFMEIFTWASPDSPDRAPPEVLELWEAMRDLVEPRLHRPGLEHPVVEVVTLEEDSAATRRERE
jgi:hypothetical protein